MKAFQLKIVIKNSKPPIWRRVIVPAGITFSQLSMILNEVMGWCGYHMFEFEFYHLELRIMEGVEDYLQDYYFDYQEASETYIREYLEENDWFTYVYDLGDDWSHRVTVEKIIDNYEHDYPQVLKYKGNCPIEDCGGIDGYYECLDIISDENHSEYAERLAWMKSQGYSHEYDMEYINEELKTRYFYKWGKGEKRIQEELYMEQFSGVCGLNATKRDKNKKNNVHTSKKHNMENSLQMFADVFKASCNSLDVLEPQFGITTLKDIFDDYTKDEILEIAKEKGIKGVSAFNKEQLIAKVTEYMLKPDVLKSYFVCLQDEEIGIFETAMRDGVMYTPGIDKWISKLYCSSYVGVLSDGRVDVPTDVKMVYHVINDTTFQQERKIYSYLLSCLQTVTVLYGIVPIHVFKQLLDRNTEVCIKEEQITEMLTRIPPEFVDHILVGDRIYHEELFPDDRGLLAAQGNKEYYIPTYKEIMDLGKLGYLPDNASLKKLESFLVNQLGAMDDEAEFAVKIIQMMMCADCEIQEVYEVLEDLDLIAENDKQMNRLVRHINEMWNNTRMLLNRGYTPNEIVNRESKVQVAPLMRNNTSNIISFDKVKQNKVYPNDPCPCGSGKKYKNCCKGK